MKIKSILILCETEIDDNNEDIADDINSFKIIKSVFTDKAMNLLLLSMNFKQHLLLIHSLTAMRKNIIISDSQIISLADKIIMKIINIKNM